MEVALWYAGSGEYAADHLRKRFARFALEPGVADPLDWWPHSPQHQRGAVGWRCQVKRSQFEWWENASIALGIWLFALLTLWPRRGHDVERLIRN